MKRDIVEICAAAALLIVAAIVERQADLPMWGLLLLYLPPYLVVGHEVLAEAVENARKGNLFNEDFLMTVATLGALGIGFLPGGECEMAEAVFVMLFFKVGELFEEYAEGRSRDSISHLVNLKPAVAHRQTGETEQDVRPEDLSVGDVVIVRSGEKIPADGTIVNGASSLNTVALTGESEPRDVSAGDQALSGCVNTRGVLYIRVDKAYADSTAAKVMRLVEEADKRKSRSETFIARFAKVYTPIVVFLALGLAVVPPIFSADPFLAAFTIWLGRALTFLVVSCPCALVISVPLTFFGGIGGASRNGILVKGSRYMDVLAKLGTVVFDKTGTLTQGEFAVSTVCPDKCDEGQLLHIAAHVERFSSHPIAAALVAAHANLDDGCEVTDVEELAGMGLKAKVNGKHVAVGNTSLMESVGAKVTDHNHVGTVVHVAIDGEYAGHVVVEDKVKADAAEAIEALHAAGVRRTVMLTGDRQAVADKVARGIGLDEWHADLLPADKVSHVERLLAEREGGGTLAFVGDGINDAPVLARADVGIAMGAMGSDAAIEAADVVLMDDKPSKVAMAIGIARRVLGIARQNVAFAIGVKVAVLLLAAAGVAGMWMAVFADVGVTVLAVLNAMRALKVK